MGKSDRECRERVTDANKVPLGRPGFMSGAKPDGAASLLKPSYLSGSEGDKYSGSSGSSSGHFSMFPSSSSSSSGSSSKYQDSSKYQESSRYQESKYPVPDMSKYHIQDSTKYHDYSRPNMNMSNHDQYHQQQSHHTVSQYNYDASKLSLKRENDDSNEGYGNGSGLDDERARERKRKRRSRWQGGTDEKAVIPGMPTILPSEMSPDQQEAYISQLQIEELTRKLRSGDLGIAPNPEDRSPSPEPIYSTDGKRLNTREWRTRKQLEDERHRLIQRLQKLLPEYKPPADYRAPLTKIVERVPIPQEEHPEINFVGLLIGPRGNTLKGLEKDTGAKIIIRGKGSVKEGKVGGKAGHPLPGEDEPLHAYVTSNNEDSVAKACSKIREIIRQGIDMPESQNDLRKNQLRELALLNGTLREGEGPKCSNCGATSHRTWHCPDKPNVTNSVICTVCGGAGHIARDCRFKRPGAGGPPNVDPTEKAKIDEEYMSLMAELGEAPPQENARMFSRPKFSSGSGLFDKPSAPKAIMPVGDSAAGNSSSSALPPSMAWGSSSQPPPPGDMSKPSQSQSMPPMPPSSWGYMPGYPPPMPAGGQQWGSWAPPPPMPPPPGTSQPPPPGMYWPPPPPPPDGSQPPPPPPS